MRIARILGTVVSTWKDPRLEGMRFLLVQPVGPDGKDAGEPLVAADTVGAGASGTVLVATGPAAQQTGKTRDCPVDAAIVGIVDSVSVTVSRKRRS